MQISGWSDGKPLQCNEPIRESHKQAVSKNPDGVWRCFQSLHSAFWQTSEAPQSYERESSSKNLPFTVFARAFNEKKGSAALLRFAEEEI